MIYAITLSGVVLSGSAHTGWDACWDAIWQYRMQEMQVGCTLIEVRDSAAPSTSTRPVGRDDQ